MRGDALKQAPPDAPESADAGVPLIFRRAGARLYARLQLLPMRGAQQKGTGKAGGRRAHGDEVPPGL